MLNGQDLYARARTILPGGTQLLSKRPEMFAPGHWPPYYAEAHGIYLCDLEGRQFADMSMMSVGACLLGYADPDVDEAVIQRIRRGTMSSLNSDAEVQLAELLLEIHPWAGMVRYARGGGEALAVAVRIARASTGRSKVAFCGYHGWHDWYLAANHTASGAADELAGHLLAGLQPLGVPRELAGTAIPFSYNRADQLEKIVAVHGDGLAAIVMEPTRLTAPDPGFLPAVRELADRCGAVLIFDEVSVGWRLCLGGAHLGYSINPDVAVFSKAIANGYAMAAVLGIGEVMRSAEESFISSTMWSEGIGPTAAIAAITKYRRTEVATHVAEIGNLYRDGISDLALKHGVPTRFLGHPALSTMCFDHPQAAELQTLLTTRMLDDGFLATAAFYPSLAHKEEHITRFLAAAEFAFEELGEAIRCDDVVQRLRGATKHGDFKRLA